MNSTIEKDEGLNNIQIPKTSSTQEAEDYQLITPFDSRIDTDFDVESEKYDKLREWRHTNH